MVTYRVTTWPTPGTIAAAGRGDTVVVYRNATERHDWAATAQAIMTAYARGADVQMEGKQDG